MSHHLEQLLDELPRREHLAWRQAVSRSEAAIAAMSRSEVGAERRFAAIAWSSIAEPGDRDAGELVALLGAVAAARLVLRGEPTEAIRAALQGSGAAEPLLEEPGRLARAVARWAPRARLERVVDAAHAGLRTGARMVVPGDPDWPNGCDDLGPSAPHMLWVRGDRGPAVLGDATQRAAGLGGLGAAAIVGSRAASAYGEHVAIDLADGLARRGSVIVSGGAYGIDVAAHRAALACDAPTIAVLAGGSDRLYPVGNAEVLRRIMVRGGAVVSELPCGQAPTRWRFLRRNRLIAAISVATIVVEAGRRSGALNTAGHAAELGRPLGAVPGPITSVSSAGCHRLVREYDAELVTSVDDAVELIRGLDGGASAHPELDGVDWCGAESGGRLGEAGGPASAGPASGGSVRDELEGDLLRTWDSLSRREWQTPQRVAARAGLAEAAVRGALASLELAGRASERDGGWRRAGD